MNLRHLCRFSGYLAACWALWMAGCSGAGTPTITSTGNASEAATGLGPILAQHAPAAPGRVRAKMKGGLIYSGDYYANTITIYPAKGVNPPPIGTITNGISSPERLFVDKKQNLYVSNNTSVTAYKRGKTSPFLTITDGINRPTGIVAGSDGSIYVANAGTDSVSIYPKGKSTPSKTLTMPTNDDPQNLALDASNNLYVIYLGYGSPGTGIVEFPAGSAQGKDLGIAVGWPSAIEVDRKGNLIALIDGSSIEVFPPGKTQPSKEWAVPYDGGFFLSLSQDEKKLYISSEAAGSPLSFIMLQLDYPNGKGLTNKISSDLGQGAWSLSVSPDNVL
ncbi:MAG: hypothetical protein WBW76_06945 [Candidatus Cybelea sp.]